MNVVVIEKEEIARFAVVAVGSNIMGWRKAFDCRYLTREAEGEERSDMAKLGASRPARTVMGAEGKTRMGPEPPDLSPDAYIEAIQQGGWTSDLEANLLGAPGIAQLAPESIGLLIHEARQRNDAQLWRLLAGVAERRHEDQEVVAYATEALQLQPDDVASMAVMARCAAKTRDVVAAVKWQRRILDIDSNDLGANRALAQHHYDAREYEAALPYLGRLLELEPKTRTNKLYWLLTMVKSVGLHGLAQPLTEVRRWRSFSDEEERLSHELFVLVGKHCLQIRQRTRARQYLVRAQQIEPTAEIEALLAEIPDAAPVVGGMTRPTAGTPTILGSAPRSDRSMERLAALLVSDTRDPWAKVWDQFASGAGIATSLVAVAALVLWVVPDGTETRALPDEKGRSAQAIEQQSALPVRTERDAALEGKISAPARQPALASDVATTPPAIASKILSVQPAAQSRDKNPPLATKLEKKGDPVSITKSQELRPGATPIPQAAASTPPSVVAQKPAASSASVAQPVVSPPASRPTPVVSAPVAAPPPGEARVSTPATKAEPRAEQPLKAADTPKKTADSVPPQVLASSRPVPAEVSREVAGSPRAPTAALSTGASSVAPAVPAPIPAPPLAAVKEGVAKASRQGAPVDSPAPESESTSREERGDTGITTATPTAAQPSAVTKENTPVEGALKERGASDEGTPTAAPTAFPPSGPTAPRTGDIERDTTVMAPAVAENPAAAIANSEPRAVEERASGLEDGREKVVASLPANERPAAEPLKEENLPAIGDLPEEQQPSAGASSTPESLSVSSASPVIARLSSQLPHTSQFPTRERVVSVPPEQLLPAMTALMELETGDDAVATRGRGVLRARVSGKRPKVGKNGVKIYGQYFVEVLPGPTEGTSRVRAKVVMFDWLTGRPVGDANLLAERFLNRVPE